MEKLGNNVENVDSDNIVPLRILNFLHFKYR